MAETYMKLPPIEIGTISRQRKLRKMGSRNVLESRPNRRMPNGMYGGVGGKGAKENLSLPDLPDKK